MAAGRRLAGERCLHIKAPRAQPHKPKDQLLDLGLSAQLSWTVDVIQRAKMFGLSALFVLSSLLLSKSVLSAPTAEVELQTRAAATVPAAPRFVIYSDKWVSGETGPPSVDQLTVRFHLYE